MSRLLSLGELARVTGVHASLIRHYEALGLIPPAEQMAADQPVYPAHTRRILNFVARARELDFSAARIELLLELWQDPERSSGEVKTLALSQLQELTAQQAELEDKIDTLHWLIAACHGDERPACAILDHLAGDRETIE